MSLGQGDQVLIGLHNPLHSLLRGLEGLIAEVQRSAVVGLEDEEADCHRGICLFELRMVTGEQLRKGDEVPEGFAHLLSVDRDHVVVHPVADATGASPCHILGNLAFMVREHQVHSASVDVEFLAEVFLAHHGAFKMPAGETFAPWTGPVHDVLGLSLFPKCEIVWSPLVALAVQCACSLQGVIQVAAGKHTVVMLFVVLLDIEIYGAV